jgi:hypothetical protein
MELFVISAIFFVIALVVRRREALQFRWQPGRGTWVAVGTAIAMAIVAGVLALSRVRNQVLSE